jgi:PAS domain S-box-containing protein
MLGQARSATQEVVVANADGVIVEANPAFSQLLGENRSVRRIDELPQYFSDPADVGRKMQELLLSQRSWRGQVELAMENGSRKPLLVRADPIQTFPDRLLGFVLIFSDLSERKAAEAARQSFQHCIFQNHKKLTGPLSSRNDLMLQTLKSTIIENAQLAALEITDGCDASKMPDVLESIKASVSRSIEALEHLSFGPQKLAREKK